MNTKICSRCKKDLDITQFGNSKISKDGLEHRCKECEKIRSNTKAKNKRKTYDGRCLSLLRNYKNKDKHKGFENDLDLDFLQNILQNNCLYCDSNEKIGLDRINNDLGHIKSNVNPCCVTCNIIKSNILTVDEMKLVGPIIKQIQDVRKQNNIPLIQHLLKGFR